MQLRGGKETTLTSGQTFYEGPDDVHVTGRNASHTKPAKFVVFLVKDKGAPVLVPMASGTVQTTCYVVGGGPAGIMLGYLLARGGVAVTVLAPYLKNGGKIEIAQQMADHGSARTTGLYDRRAGEISLGEVETISI